MVIPLDKSEEKGGVKVIKVEGGGEKKRRSSSAAKLSLRNGNRGIMTIFHETGTRFIPSNKDK